MLNHIKYQSKFELRLICSISKTIFHFYWLGIVRESQEEDCGFQLSQGRSGNSSGGQGEKYSLKFESQGISNLQYFSFYGFNSFEAFLSFDGGSKN